MECRLYLVLLWTFSIFSPRVKATATSTYVCDDKLDLGFILDSSGSIRAYYQKEKNFVKAVVSAFGISPLGWRSSVITFSFIAELSIRLNDYNDSQSFNAAVDRIPIMGSISRIDRALKLADAEMFEKGNGGRHDALKILILITDGSQTPTGDSEDPLHLADQLRDKGVIILAIGVGRGIDPSEIRVLGFEDSIIYSNFDEMTDPASITRMKETICKMTHKRKAIKAHVIGTVTSGTIRYNTYQKVENIIWTVNVTGLYRLTFKKFNLGFDERCKYYWLMGANKKKLCGRNLLMDVYHHGPTNLTYYSEVTNRYIFELEVEIISLDGMHVTTLCTATVTNGMIIHPASYDAQIVETCRWKININGLFHLLFKIFDLQNCSDCACDWVRVGNGTKLCGQQNGLTLHNIVGPTDLTYNFNGQEENGGIAVEIIPVDEVYVEANGTNSPTCGTVILPCRTIGYTLKKKHAKGVNIKILSDVIEPDVTHLNISGIFTIIGMKRNERVSLIVKDYYLFEALITKINIQLIFENINIEIVCKFIKILGKNSIIEVNMHSATVRTKMKNNTEDGIQKHCGWYDYIVEVTMDGFNEGGGLCLRMNLRACSFINLSILRLVYIRTVNCSSFVKVTDTVFSRNQHLRGFTFVSTYSSATSRYIFDNVLISDCKYDAWRTNYRYEMHGSFLSLVSHPGSSASLVVSSSNFSRNDGVLLTILHVSSTRVSDVDLTVRKTNFVKNQLMRDEGLIDIRSVPTSKRKPWKIVIDNIQAYQNNASVLHLDHTEECKYSECIKSKSKIMGVIVRRSLFIENTAFIRGAAIVADTTSKSHFVVLDILNSKFIRNRASSGGAISSNFLTSIINSEFHANQAALGGAILLRSVATKAKRSYKYSTFKISISKIINTVIFTSINAIDSNANLDVKNSTIILTKYDKNAVVLFRHESTSQFLDIENDTIFECAINQNVNTQKKTERVKQQTGGGTLFYSRLLVSCNPCSKGMYSASQGKAVFHKGNISITKAACLDCPRGGNCENGQLRSRPRHWGFLTGRNKKIEFVQCASGYCSSSPAHYKDCSKNRKGILCCECESRTSLSVVSSACVETSICDVSSLYYIFGSTPVISLVIVTLLLLKSRLSVFFSTFFTDRTRHVRHIIKRCSESRNDENEEIETLDIDIKDGKNNTSLLKQFLLLVFFYQIQSLIYIPNIKVNTVFWKSIQNDLGSLFTFNLQGDGSSDIAKICFPQNFTFIHRCLLNIWLNLCPVSLAFMMYLVVRCWERLFDRGDAQVTLKIQIIATVLDLMRIFYIPVTKTLLRLITCVDIVEDGKEVSVLLAQASTKCYTNWQYFIIIIIALYCVWFFAFLYVGTLYLEVKKYSEFCLMAFLPFTSLYFFFKLKKCPSQQRFYECRSTCTTSCSSKQQPIQVEVTEMEEVVEENDTLPLSPIKPVDSQQELPDRQLMDHICERLIAIIQSQCKFNYWPSVIVLRNLFVVAVPVVFRYDYSQTLATLLTLLVYLLLLVRLQPYTDAIMNQLEISLTTMLLLLGVCGIINTTYLSAKDDNISEFLAIIDNVKLVMLMLPPFLWILFMCIQKYRSANVEVLKPVERKRSNTI